MHIQLNDEMIDSIIEYRNRKTLEIQIKPPGIIKVLVPRGLKKQNIVDILQSKQEWIITKLTEVREKEAYGRQYTFTDGEQFLYLGNEVSLKLVKDSDVSQPVVKLDQGVLYVRNNVIEAEDVRVALEVWYRERTLEKVLHYVEKYKILLKCHPSAIKVKEQKKRWGSCSSKDNLMFNWRLSMTPEKVLEYVVVHEMCHLVYFDHSKAFWKLVEMYIPDYKSRKEWLQTYSRSVYF